jgi:hypothetical protein
MRYPFWLPYPKSWVQTTVLFFSCLPIYWIQYALFRWIDVSFAIYDIWHDYRDFINTYKNLILLIAIVLPIFLLSLVHQFFWGDPIPNIPAIIPAPKSLLRGAVDWATNVLGVIMAVSLWIDWKYLYYLPYIPNRLVTPIVVSWFIIVAYFYHFWFFLGRRYWRIRAKLAEKRK